MLNLKPPAPSLKPMAGGLRLEARGMRHETRGSIRRGGVRGRPPRHPPK